MKRISLPWRAALSNTSQYGEWYGVRTFKGMQLRGVIVMNPKGTYNWTLSYGGKDIGSGSETTNSGGLAAAKEAVSILATDSLA